MECHTVPTSFSRPQRLVRIYAHCHSLPIRSHITVTHRQLVPWNRRNLRRGQVAGSRIGVGTVACSAQAVGAKLLSKTEIPAFIPRSDMMEQLMRWAVIEASADGVAKFGLPIKVEPFYQEDDIWGLDIFVVKDGASVGHIGVRYDNEIITKHEWVGRGEDGFPLLEGREDSIVGRNFEIWKMDDNPVDAELRSVIRTFCEELVQAVNSYYAFGSIFSDDAT